MPRLLVASLLLVSACGPGDKDSASGGSTAAEASGDPSGSSSGPGPTTSAGTGTGTGTADDSTGGGDVDCSNNPQVFPAFDKTCAAVDDCVIVLHTDCCGPRALGLRKGQEAAFAAAEATCGMQCPPLGCDHATIAEDGDGAAQDSDIKVDCIAGQCMTFVP